MAGSYRSSPRLSVKYVKAALVAGLQGFHDHINDEYLGSETYVGTRDEFKVELAPCFQDWYYQRDDIYEGETIDEWIESQLDNHLKLADDEDVANYPRITN